MTAPIAEIVYVLLVLGIAFALRVGFLAAHLNRLDVLWSEYDRRGLSYRLAQLLDALTFIGFAACAGYALWTLPASAAGSVARYSQIFIAWFGVALLGRLAVHRFPRTNAPQLFDDAKASLLTNLLLSLLSGLAMTGVTVLYFWVRG